MFCLFLCLTPKESTPRNFSLNSLRMESVLTPLGTVANSWHTEVQKNSVQELSMWVISEGVYHHGGQEGELKKKKIKQCFILDQFHKTNKAHKWTEVSCVVVFFKSLVFLLLEPPRSEVH